MCRTLEHNCCTLYDWNATEYSLPCTQGLFWCSQDIGIEPNAFCFNHCVRRKWFLIIVFYSVSSKAVARMMLAYLNCCYDDKMMLLERSFRSDCKCTHGKDASLKSLCSGTNPLHLCDGAIFGTTSVLASVPDLWVWPGLSGNPPCPHLSEGVG